MTKKTSLTMIMGATLFLGGTAVAIAAPNGAELAKDKCQVCHGANGNSDYEEVPNIASLSPTYFKQTMNAYKSGERPSEKFTAKGQDETNMKAITADLSEDQVAALADFYGDQYFEAREQDFKKKLARKGKTLYRRHCKKCHSANGSEPEDDAGILAGQSKSYLRTQLNYFINKERWQDKGMEEEFDKMRKKIEDRKGKDKVEKYMNKNIEKLLHFFAKQ